MTGGVVGAFIRTSIDRNTVRYLLEPQRATLSRRRRHAQPYTLYACVDGYGWVCRCGCGYGWVGWWVGGGSCTSATSTPRTRHSRSHARPHFFFSPFFFFFLPESESDPEPEEEPEEEPAQRRAGEVHMGTAGCVVGCRAGVS